MHNFSFWLYVAHLKSNKAYAFTIITFFLYFSGDSKSSLTDKEKRLDQCTKTALTAQKFSAVISRDFSCVNIGSRLVEIVRTVFTYWKTMSGSYDLRVINCFIVL